MARKKELDAQVEAKRKETKEFEIKMRQKAGTVGNIVGKSVPVSQTEVSPSFLCTPTEIVENFSRTITLRSEHGILQGRPTNHLPRLASCRITKYYCV